MIEVNRAGEGLIFAEQHEGKLEDTSLELMSKGRALADELGVGLSAVLMGDNVCGLAERLGDYGADKVYLAEHPLVDH